MTKINVTDSSVQNSLYLCIFCPHQVQEKIIGEMMYLYTRVPTFFIINGATYFDLNLKTTNYSPSIQMILSDVMFKFPLVPS